MFIRILIIVLIFVYFVFLNIDYLRLVKKNQKLESKIRLLTKIDEKVEEVNENDIFVNDNVSNAEDTKD